MTECGCKAGQGTVLIYGCSGAANVGEIADRVARRLTAEGRGRMFCLAGLGANLEKMVQSAREAELNLVLDGCGMDCSRGIFERLGLKNVKVIRVTDLGIAKAKGVPVTEAQVELVLAKAREALAA